MGGGRGGHALSWFDYFDRRCGRWLPAVGQLPSHGLPAQSSLARQLGNVDFWLRQNESAIPFGIG